MNILGLVFTILLILSYGYYASWNRHVETFRLRHMYGAHQEASRKLLNSFQSQVYAGLDGACSAPKRKSQSTIEVEPEDPEEEIEKPIAPNPSCSRINVWPLIQEGREEKALLYTLTLHLIQTFYQPLFEGKKNFETYFLDTLLSAAKRACEGVDPISLEKISLLDSELQYIYYKMLKGTKQWNLEKGIGYPPLLEYLKMQPGEEKICLFHAHPDLLSVLFSPQMGRELYREVHRKNGSPLTRELIQKTASDLHLLPIDEKLFDLLQFGRSIHKEKTKVFTAEEETLFLRKSIPL